MPTYEYQCDACSHGFEREQRITEDAIKKCPKCKKLKARRMINGGGFILKGGNWESDLYSGASNKAADKPPSSDTDSSTTDSSTSDSKKTETKSDDKKAKKKEKPKKAASSD